jgi:hypothetical protein
MRRVPTTVAGAALAVLLAALSATLSLAAAASPATSAPLRSAATQSTASFATYTVARPGCSFDDVTADAVSTSGGLTRGMVSFHGGSCGSTGWIYYFEGAGTSWRSVRSLLHGRVLRVADDGAATWLLYQNQGIYVTSRPHSGGMPAGSKVSSFAGTNPYPSGDIVAQSGRYWAVWTEQLVANELAPFKLFESKTIGAGDCTDPILKHQLTFLAGWNDDHPTMVLRPAAAGLSTAEVWWSRNDGARGQTAHIYHGSLTCQGTWNSIGQLSTLGYDGYPDANRSSAGNDHLVFNRNGDRVVYIGISGNRVFTTLGFRPRVSTSQGVLFVAYTNAAQHPFAAIHRSGWAGYDLTPGAGAQRLLALTAASGRGTAVAASFATDRLYAVPGL